MSLFEVLSESELYTLRLSTQTLEATNAAEFKSSVGELELPDSGRVAVDCETLEFIDSSGLGALLHLNNTLSKASRPLILRNLSPEVLSVVELLRLNTVFALES